MGEIFRQESPAQPLEFTGERWTTAAHGQIEIEHLHRYLLARDWCRGKDVLDIASGEGYGKGERHCSRMSVTHKASAEYAACGTESGESG